MSLFLENNPTESYLKSEKERLEKSIDNCDKNYSYWLTHNAPRNVDTKKLPSLYSTCVGLGNLKKQLKTINYLIN